LPPKSLCHHVYPGKLVVDKGSTSSKRIGPRAARILGGSYPSGWPLACCRLRSLHYFRVASPGRNPQRGPQRATLPPTIQNYAHAFLMMNCAFL